MTKRATIADIAQRAGLSKGAVSYALNGLPGPLGDVGDGSPLGHPPSPAAP